jgi:hypothetical protein
MTTTEELFASALVTGTEGGFTLPSVLTGPGDQSATPDEWLTGLTVRYITDDATTRKVIAKLTHLLNQHTKANPLLVALDVETTAANGLKDDYNQLVTEAASEQRAIADVPIQLADFTRRLRDAWIDRQIVQLTARLADPSLSHDEQVKLVQQQLHLRSAKRLPLAPRADA